MADIVLPKIITIGNTWHISGDVRVENAHVIFSESTTFVMNEVVNVDFSDVTDVDTAALSLMMEWQRRALDSRTKIGFSHVPANLISLAELYGVTEFIPLQAK